MSCECKKQCFILFKGYSSRWNAVDWLSINFTGIIDTEGFSARFRIGNYTFTTNDLSQELVINLTDEQTATLPLGINTASLIVYDIAGAGKPFTTNIPVLVKDWEDGDVTIDTYKATIKATLENETQLTINVEAGISVEVIPQVVTLPVGSDAYVQNIGTPNHLILKFGIPQGEKGEQGEVGPAGKDAKIIIRRL